MQASKIEPDPELRKRLRDGAQEIAGFELYDVRWDSGRKVLIDGKHVLIQGHDCLCIMEQHVATKNWVARKPLRGAPSDPDAYKVVETEQPDGSRVECDVPLDEEDDEFLEKVVGIPRQITEQDVQEALDSARNAYKRSKEIAAKLTKQKDDQRREQFALREDYVTEAAKELANLFWQERTGKNAFVDLGHVNSAGSGSSEGFTVNDNRRVS